MSPPKIEFFGAQYYHTFGFLVLRHFFDPCLIAAEIDQVLRNGPRSSRQVAPGDEIHFQYVPMMTAETPGSLQLLDRAEIVAATLLGGPVLPTRAKGTRYWGETPWHSDSDLPIASLGVVTYSESLREKSGALRVLPGSHRAEFRAALHALGAVGQPAEKLPAHILETEPGDVIMFDEHLFHASSGGGTRRQWRVDFFREPTSPEERQGAEAYLRELYRPDWDGGYDVDRYPSYGSEWRNSGRPSVKRLQALGVYELAAKQEAFTRSRR